MKKFVFFLVWVSSLILASVYTYENPDKIDIIKYYFKSHLPSKIKFEKGTSQRALGNSFAVEFSQEISFSERTAFVVYDDNNFNFNKNLFRIYFQHGYL